MLAATFLKSRPSTPVLAPAEHVARRDRRQPARWRRFDALMAVWAFFPLAVVCFAIRRQGAR